MSYSLTDKFSDGLVVCAGASVEAVCVDGARTADQRPQRRCWNNQSQALSAFNIHNIQGRREKFIFKQPLLVKTK